MKRKFISNRIILLLVWLIDLFPALAGDLATGELAWQANGDPAMIGQTTNDHLFSRNEYSDNGYVDSYDNVISFQSGKTQLVWFWLDDDQVYETQWIQNLTPDTYNTAGDRYNEITYSSVQFDLYVPRSLKMIITEDEEGNEVSYVGGPRLPLSGIILFWGKQDEPKVIDGITYDVYTVVQSNSTNGFKHFSAKTANLYKKNGALKKDDGALVGLYFLNTNQDILEGRIDDIIIANVEFGISECRDQDANHQRFIYGTGGNNESQRFHLYNRIAVYGSKGFGDSSVKATSISLNKSSLDLDVGNSSQLIATVYPSNTTNKVVSWKSSNPSVASVNSNGVVNAISSGTTIITATTTDGTDLSASCVVTVNVSATSIYLSATSMSLDIGDTSQLMAYVYPSNTTNKSVTWRSSNSSVATVNSNGWVTAISPGTANITATTTDGSYLSATCKVTVNEQKATSISLNKSNLSLYVNQSSQLTATVYPSNTGNKTVTWSSSNNSVAKVSSNGLVTAVAAGNAIITATTTDGSNLTASCYVSVSIIPVTSVSLNQTRLTLDVNTTQQLVASVLPSNATYKTVTWSTSNPAVAMVSSNGQVSSISPGYATITATSTDGTNISASCQVTVVKLVKNISFNKSSLTLFIPEKEQLYVTITPSDATNRTLNWASSNSAVAIVDDNGLITPIATGTVTIKATTTDGSNLSASCVVTVKRQLVTSISLNTTKLVLQVGETSQLRADVAPDNASNKVLSWTSVNPSVATVDNNGLVTAKSGGTTYIKASATDGSGVYGSCTVEVIPDYYVTLDSVSFVRGSETQIVDLPVSLTNKNPISGIQYDVSFPSGVKLNLIDNQPDVWLDEARKTRSHSIYANQLSTNTYRILVTSSSSKDLKGNAGELVHMNLLLPQFCNIGNYAVNVFNVIASEANETRHTLSNASSNISYYYLVGDADANAIVDIADHTATASKVLGKSPSPFYSDAADVDGNLSLDVVDLVGITNIALELKPISIRQMPRATIVPDRIFCERAIFNPDGEAEISFGIDCGFDFAGFQIDLKLPHGMRLLDASLGDQVSGLSLMIESLPNDEIRILGTSFADVEVKGLCSKLLILKMKADGLYQQNYSFDFSNIIFAERDLTAHYFDGSNVEFINTSSVYELIDEAKIYVENGYINVDTPTAGAVRIISIDGHMIQYDAQIGHNEYPVVESGIYIINFLNKTIKVKL